MQRKKELIKNEKNNENYCFVKKSEKNTREAEV